MFKEYEQAEQWARDQVGKTEEPPNSNHTFIWRIYHRLTGAPAYQGSPYCGAGGVVLHRKARFMAPANWIGCFAIQSWGEATKRWRRGGVGVKRGDQLIIGGPGVHTETALCDADEHGNVAESWGCNTSPRAGSGDQFNGGAIAIKPRSAAEIYGHVHLHDIYVGEAKAPRRVKAARKPTEPQYRKEQATGALHLWETGPRVAKLQRELGMDDDGYFGRSTVKAVAKAGKRFKVPTTGGKIATVALLHELERKPAAKKAMPPTLRQGAKGGVVRKLQRLLVAHGHMHDIAVDGVYGLNTADAVRRFKARHGLDSNGKVVGRAAWTALLKPA